MRYVKHGLIMCLFDSLHPLSAFLSYIYIYILIYYHYLFTFWVPGVSTVSKLENIILLLFIPCILFKFIYLCTKFLIFLRYNLLTFNENLMFLQMHVFVEIYLLKLI